MNPANLSTGIKTLTIKPGETLVLPKGSVVKSLIYDGAIDVTSTCDDLPEPQAYNCYVLIFSSNENRSASPNLEGEDTNIDFLEVAGVKYNGPVSLNHLGNDLGDIMRNTLTTWFSTAIPQTLFKFDHLDLDTTAERVTAYVYFKSVDSIVNSIDLQISGPGFDNGLHVFPAAAGDNCS